MNKNKKQNEKSKQAKQIYLERKECFCVAQKHQLINNCLFCGKVVCSLEGEGPCFFCGNNVTKPDSNYEIMNSESLFPSLSKDKIQEVTQERSKAILHRNKLVEKDKSTQLQQNIFDEQLDYYQITENQWIDEKDRQMAVERILQKDNYLEEEKLRYRAVFDPLTSQFVREQIKFDEQKFKEEGQQFASDKIGEEIKKKNEKIGKSWDQRLMNNEKMKKLCEDLLVNKQAQAKKNVKLITFDKGIILQQQQIVPQSQ